MKILPCSNSQSFTSSYRILHLKDRPNELPLEASTSFFVPFLQWNKFTDLIIEKSKNLPKINLYSLACSDGSEAYSLAMLLMTKLSTRDQEKFFPIIAIDTDDDIMNNARNGVIDLSRQDEVNINHYTNNNLKQFLTKTEDSHWTDYIADTDRKIYLTRYKINPNLRDKVQFLTNDINSYLDNISNDNNVFFCRNVWRYLHKNSEEISQKLSDKMNENSYLVIGRIDNVMCPMTRKNCFGLYMDKDFLNVFTKNKSDYFDLFRVFHLSDFKDY